MDKKFIGAPVGFKLSGDAGQFEATFSLFNSKDLDGDVTLKGAFQDGAEVRIAQWGHNWGAPAIGKGIIHADHEKAWVEGQFFLNSQAGKDTYEAVKGLGSLQQWSYGYDIKDSEKGDFNGEKVRYLKELDVHEISPVMLGAQPLTETTAIKEAKVGARNAASDLKMIQGMHDTTAQLGADCGAKGRKGRKQYVELVLEGSYEALGEDIDEAAEDLFGEAPDREIEVIGTYPDYAVVSVLDWGSGEDDPTVYTIPYTVDAMGVVTLGPPVEVEINSTIVPKSRQGLASRKTKPEDRESGKGERGPDLSTWRDLASLLAT